MSVVVKGVIQMFLGEYQPRMDEKGRLILPAKFREMLNGGMVLTRGQEHCIYVFPRSEFLNVHEQLKQAPLTSRDARNYMRVFLSGAVDDTPDKQGRITIPANLRQWANLDRDVAVIGMGARAEIWDKAAWEATLDAHADEFADQSEEIVPGVF